MKFKNLLAAFLAFSFAHYGHCQTHADPECDPGKVGFVANKCFCNKLTQEWNDGACVPKCAPHQERGKDHQCRPRCVDQGVNLENVDGACMSKCPEGQERIGKSEKCATPCPYGSVRNSSGECIAEAGSGLPACMTGYERMKRDCAPGCPAAFSGTPDACKKECVQMCPLKYMRDPCGKCIPECRSHEEYINGECKAKCSPNHKRNEKGECYYCPEN